MKFELPEKFAIERLQVVSNIFYDHFSNTGAPIMENNLGVSITMAYKSQKHDVDIALIFSKLQVACGTMSVHNETNELVHIPLVFMSDKFALEWFIKQVYFCKNIDRPINVKNSVLTPESLRTLCNERFYS